MGFIGNLEQALEFFQWQRHKYNMKKRNIVLLIILLLIVFGFLILLHNKSKVLVSKKANELQSQQLNKIEIKKNDQQANAISNMPHATNVHVSGIPDSVMSYVKKIQIDPQYDWKQPITFYGRVVDGSNVVVVGASIHFNWTDLSEKGTSQADTKSESNGGFLLTGQHGKRLSVTASKDGYYTYPSEKLSSFEYANPADGLFTPDAGNPIVFHLRKKGQSADLIHGVQLFGFHTNGPVQYLDLLKSKNTLTPPGDLTAQFTRSPRNSNARYDWTVTISVPDGGLLESDDEFMFEAPADGYQPKIEIKVAADDPHWFAVATKRFYFKSRNGSVYGRAEAKINSLYQKAAASDLDYYVNPSGSRNLEPK
jgi:hypothetical protein